MYNNKFVYKVVIWVLSGISLWKEKEDLTHTVLHKINHSLHKLASVCVYGLLR